MMKKIFAVAFLSLVFGATSAQDFMMQGWYWDYPKTASSASWADTLRNKAEEIGQAGFTNVWLPPLSRSSSGPYSNGYDPKDLYDYGEYGQGPTGFGSRSKLDQLISAFNLAGISAVADLVYNHRDGGKAENNDGLSNYIAGYNFVKASSGANPFPYDRMRVILPIGGSTENVSGDYYFKLSSSSGHSKFHNYEYKVYFQTNKVGWQNLSNLSESEPNGGGDCSQTNNTTLLGREMYATVDASGCGVDEFKLTLTADDFFSGGDTIFIYFGKRNSGYSDVRIYSIWCAPRSANIVSELKYQSYTNFSGLPSGQGAMNWSNFKPNNDRPTNLEGAWDGMYFYYDYDQFQTDTKSKLYDWTRWNWSNVGIRGLRMDAVKHFTPEFVGDLLDNLYDYGMSPPLVVGEWYGTSTDELSGWVNSVYNYMDNDTKLAIAPRIFDFSLREALRSACDVFGYDARNVFGASIVDQGKLDGLNVVTFANNHDFRSSEGFESLIKNDRMLAYAYLLTNNQIGLPTVFYPDFFGYSSNDPGYYPSDKSAKKTQISQLMQIHRNYIFGSDDRTYLNNFAGGRPNNLGVGNANVLVYQLKGTDFKNLVVAINFSGNAISFNQQLDGIAFGTKLNELTGNSTTSAATVEEIAGGISNSIYIQIPARSYAIWRVGAWSLFTEGRSNISFNVKGTNTDFTVWNNASGTVQNADLGTFTGSDVLQISAYDIRSWKASGGDVTGGTFYYTVYPKGQRPGSPVFLSQPVTWQADIGGSGTTDQRWGFTGALNVLAGLSAGEYTIEFYTQMNGTDPIKSEYDNNGGAAANYTAHFRYNYIRSAADGNWSSTSSWLNSIVPGSGETAEINNAIAVDGAYTCAALTINPGKSLTINPGNSLTVTNASGLLIKSDVTGTGSLITSNAVNATVERFITKYNGTFDKMYHFISSPVSDQAIFTDLTDFYRFSELNNYWISRTGNGTPEAFGDASFVVGRGYMVANSTDITKTFSGTLNTYPSATPLTITCTKTTGKGEGWNLLGNPFSSAIDWDLVKTRNSGVDNALYYYDAAQQNYRYYIQLGSIGTLGSGSRYIPAMQGFMVHANTNNGTVTINNDDRVHQALTTYYKQGGSPSNLLILKVEANGFEDETNLFFTDLANTAFDSEYDAYKIFSANENVPQLYSIASDDTKLAINSMPENISGTSVVLGIKTGSETASTLTASSIDSFESGTEITLIDNKTNNIQNLTKNPVYNFTSTQGDDPARFELKFGTVGINDPIVNPLINAWYNAGKLYLVNDAGNTNIEVYNLQGQTIKKLFVQDGGLQTISLNLPAGVYFAQIISNGINQTVKIIIP